LSPAAFHFPFDHFCFPPPEGVYKGEWFRWIMDHCDFDELIWEHTPKGTHWIHVATKRNGNRHRVIN